MQVFVENKKLRAKIAEVSGMKTREMYLLGDGPATYQMTDYLGVGSSHDGCTYTSLFLLYMRITQKQGHYIVDGLSLIRGKYHQEVARRPSVSARRAFSTSNPIIYSIDIKGAASSRRYD